MIKYYDTNNILLSKTYDYKIICINTEKLWFYLYDEDTQLWQFKYDTEILSILNETININNKYNQEQLYNIMLSLAFTVYVANYLDLFNKNIISLNNKIINMNTGEERERNYDDYCTHYINIKNKNKTYSTMEEFMKILMLNKKHKTEYLQKILGSVCTFTNIIHVLYGNGKNGKKTLMSLMKKTLNKYVLHININNYSIIDLINVKLIVITDGTRDEIIKFGLKFLICFNKAFVSASLSG